MFSRWLFLLLLLLPTTKGTKSSTRTGSLLRRKATANIDIDCKLYKVDPLPIGNGAEPEGEIQCIDQNGQCYEVENLDQKSTEILTNTIKANGIKGDGPPTITFKGAGLAKGKSTKEKIVVAKREGSNNQGWINKGNEVKGNSKNNDKSKGGANSNPDRRQLTIRYSGISTVLVLRVIALDAEYPTSKDTLRDRVFGGNGDNNNLAMTTDACSYGKLRFVPPPNNPSYPALVDGVVDVSLNMNVTDMPWGDVTSATKAIAESLVGPLSQFDHVMYMLPSQVDFAGAAAWGYFWAQTTVYNGGYGDSAYVQMHEIGHNLGLSHSGEDGASYGDTTCFMGAGWNDPDQCYNAAKSYTLGWYEEFQKDIDIISVGSWDGKLAGLADYQNLQVGSDDYSIILKIRTYESEELHLTYNRKQGVNAGVLEHGDSVTIVRADGGGQSWLDAVLKPGSDELYTVPIIVGSGWEVTIEVCDTYNSDEPGVVDYAWVKIYAQNTGIVDTLPSPVAHYKFDNDLLDSSGNSFDASVALGAPTYTTDSQGTFLSFNNGNDISPKEAVSLGQRPELDFGSTSDFSVSFWVRSSYDFSLDSPYNDGAIISNKNWNSGRNAGWVIAVGGDGRWQWNIADGVTRCDFDGPPGQLNDGEWHHIVVSHDRVAGVATMYWDGSSIASKSCLADVGSATTTYPTIIGTDGYLGAQWPAFFTGDIDNLSIYDSALSHVNAFSLFMAGREGAVPNPSSPTPPQNNPQERQCLTRQPTAGPTATPACIGSDPDTCGCEEVKQADYRGTISKTAGGLDCQSWTAQSPHGHSRTPQNYPNSGLESNYCRNPDGEPAAWCYTTDPNTRWDYCAVPTCSLEPPPTDAPVLTTLSPTPAPIPSPTLPPTSSPTFLPTSAPTLPPTPSPTLPPTSLPTALPTLPPTPLPTPIPTLQPTPLPTALPTLLPTPLPTPSPTLQPTPWPTLLPTPSPTPPPTPGPTSFPTLPPTIAPTPPPTAAPPTTGTPVPTITPACAGSDPNFCGCQNVKEADYRGTLSVTESGRTCQAWSEQYPHGHSRTPQNYPNSGLVLNYCRNPDGEPRAWCYTSDPNKRWEYCSVPDCINPACAGSDPSFCGCQEVKQADYRGTISTTVGGLSCQSWTAQSPHGHSRTPQNYPNSGLESNYCRNPDGEPAAWCYTTDPSKRWDYCEVPVCSSQ